MKMIEAVKRWWSPAPLPLQQVRPFLEVMERCQREMIQYGDEPQVDEVATRAVHLGLMKLSLLGTDAECWSLTWLGKDSLAAATKREGLT